MKMTIVRLALMALSIALASTGASTTPQATASIGARNTAGGLGLPAEAVLKLKDFHFASGEVLPELKLHYLTLGEPAYDQKGEVTNAVMLLHGTTGSGLQFLNPVFAAEMFAPGQPLDLTQFFVILPDAIGHGGSSKPSDGLHARFPHYDYSDIVQAQHQLALQLKAPHLYMLLGTSMGGMNTWQWAETFPDASRYLVALACVPAPITGRNLLWRRMIINAIRFDPAYNNGDYATPLLGFAAIHPLFGLMTRGQGELKRSLTTPEEADAAVVAAAASALTEDPNDVAYAFDASRTYNPSGELAQIKGRLLTINFADDELNNHQFDLVDAAVKQVPGAKAVTVAESADTRGHATHTIAAVWKQALIDFMAKP